MEKPNAVRDALNEWKRDIQAGQNGGAGHWPIPEMFKRIDFILAIPAPQPNAGLREKMLAILEKVEWIHLIPWDADINECLVCAAEGKHQNEHKSNCELKRVKDSLGLLAGSDKGEDTEHISVGFHPVKNVIQYFVGGIGRECSIAEARDIGKLFLHQADKLEKFPRPDGEAEIQKAPAAKDLESLERAAELALLYLTNGRISWAGKDVGLVVSLICDHFRDNGKQGKIDEILNAPRFEAAQPDASPGAPSLTHEQAYAEIRDTLADSMLNTAQKKAFVISILEGKLANPPKFGGYNG